MESSSGSQKHARCGASSAERWLNCPGSLFAQQGLKDTSSIYAAEGTAAHGRAELHLSEWLKSKRHPKAAEGDEPLQLYLDRCVQEAALLPDPAIRVELRLTLNEEMAMFGTADFVVTGSNGKATIIDLKWGTGVPVDAGSPQLAYYATALWRTSKRDIKEVKVVVVQPRFRDEDRRITEAYYSLEDLRNWYFVFTKGAENAIFQLMLKKPTLSKGKWCQFCKAKKTCKEFNGTSFDEFSSFEP